MNTTNITSRVFNHDDSIKHMTHNFIEGMLYIPHLTKAYHVVNIDLDTVCMHSEITYKDYLKTILKVAFLFTCPKIYLAFTAAAIIQRQFHSYEIVSGYSEPIKNFVPNNLQETPTSNSDLKDSGPTNDSQPKETKKEEKEVVKKIAEPVIGQTKEILGIKTEEIVIEEHKETTISLTIRFENSSAESSIKQIPLQPKFPFDLNDSGPNGDSQPKETKKEEEVVKEIVEPVIEQTKKILDIKKEEIVIEEHKETTISLITRFENSFAASSIKPIPLQPKSYIFQAFYTISDYMTKLNKIPNFICYLNEINQNKTQILEIAEKIIGQTKIKEILEKAFDEELKKIESSMIDFIDSALPQALKEKLSDSLSNVCDALEKNKDHAITLKIHDVMQKNSQILIDFISKTFTEKKATYFDLDVVKNALFLMKKITTDKDFLSFRKSLTSAVMRQYASKIEMQQWKEKNIAGSEESISLCLLNLLVTRYNNESLEYRTDIKNFEKFLNQNNALFFLKSLDNNIFEENPVFISYCKKLEEISEYSTPKMKEFVLNLKY